MGTLEGVTDRGYIVETMPKGDIPLGMWMGYIWYYPKFGKTLTQLNDMELKEVNMQGDILKENLKINVNEQAQPVKRRDPYLTVFLPPQPHFQRYQ